MTKVKITAHNSGHSYPRTEVELQVNVEPDLASEQPKVRSTVDALKKRFDVVKVHVEGLEQ